MGKIKVGEYVRTNRGEIYKIEDGTEFYEDSVNVGIGIIPDVDGIWVDRKHFYYVDKRDIVKHSPNIIDLIEIGDLVKIEDNCEAIHWFEVYENSGIYQYDILEIATKEMMESISYKVTKEQF